MILYVSDNVGKQIGIHQVRHFHSQTVISLIETSYKHVCLCMHVCVCVWELFSGSVLFTKKNPYIKIHIHFFIFCGWPDYFSIETLITISCCWGCGLAVPGFPWWLRGLFVRLVFFFFFFSFLFFLLFMIIFCNHILVLWFCFDSQ